MINLPAVAQFWFLKEEDPRHPLQFAHMLATK